MKALFSFIICAFAALTASAQSPSASVTFFTQDGQKFWVIMDGIKQNDKPDANVKVTGLTNPNYRAKIIFADNTIPAIDKNIQVVDYDNKFFDATYNIQKDKKGKMVVKISSFSESKGGPTSAQTVPFHTEDTYGSEYNTYGKDNTTKTTTTTTTQNVGIKQDVNVGNDGRVGTSQSVSTPDGGAVKMDMNMGATGGGIKVDDGMGGKVDMNINMGGIGMDGTGATGTTTTTTTTKTTVTTTTSGGGSMERPDATGKPNNIGPNTPVNTAPATNVCAYPASTADMSNLTGSIKKQSFSDNKMNVAKTFIKNKCLSVAQIKEVMGLFSFEDSKLEFAKLAYDRCSDKENYYMVGDALTFSSSQDELTNFINSK